MEKGTSVGPHKSAWMSSREEKAQEMDKEKNEFCDLWHNNKHCKHQLFYLSYVKYYMYEKISEVLQQKGGQIVDATT